jgi:hypothetical protein
MRYERIGNSFLWNGNWKSNKNVSFSKINAMKFSFLALFVFFVSTAFGQLVGGDVIAEQRDVIPETTFIMEGARNGWAVVTLAVNREGAVTSVQIKETNLKSSIDKMDLRKFAQGIRFEPGTHYPKFHHAEVRITMIESENARKEIEIVID